MRVKNDRFNTKEGHSSGSWLGFNGTREWRHDDGTGLGLPESVNDGTFLLPNVFVIPVPSLRVDRLANTTQHSEGAKVVGVDMVLTETTEEADGGGSSVDVGNLVLLNSLPVAGRGRVNWRGFEDSGGDTVEKGSVHNVANGTGKSEGTSIRNVELTCDQ